MSFAFIPPGFYFLGSGEPTQTRQVILGTDSLVFLQGNCESFAQATIYRSPSNAAYSQALQATDQLQNQANQLNRQYQAIKSSTEDPMGVKQQLRQLDQQKLALLDSVEKVHPLLRKAIALRTYLVSPEIQEQYPSEVAFFAQSYFSQVDFSDSAYHTMPLLNEAFYSYGMTLGSVSLPFETILGYTNEYLKQLPKPGPTHKMAVLGLTSGFRDRNDDAFVYFANLYLNTYGPSDNPEFAAQLRKEVTDKQALLIGSLAPDLSLPTPEGDTISISDFRGEIVLLDFWASWCRPCRMENPRVVSMYKKYNDQGFTIIGLSLDRGKDAWVKAIAEDQLPWHHASDLLFWNSIASRTYKVSSIPYTVLLDREGKIVAKGLRGAALEAKVAELLKSQPQGN